MKINRVNIYERFFYTCTTGVIHIKLSINFRCEITGF
jgi:hypothetical protein